MDQFKAVQDHSGRDNGLEAEHRPNPPFDSAMILFNTVVELLALPDPDRLEPASWTVLRPALGITRQDGFTIGLTAVDDDPLRPAVPLQRLAQKALSSNEIPQFTEPELNRVAVAVDSSVKVQ
jgi:hypothetical protein